MRDWKKEGLSPLYVDLDDLRLKHCQPQFLSDEELLSIAQLNWDGQKIDANIGDECQKRGLHFELKRLLIAQTEVPNH